MLDPWIIEEIRRREEAQRGDEERRPVVVQVPYHEPPPEQGGAPARVPGSTPAPGDDDPPRGVAIIDYIIG